MIVQAPQKLLRNRSIFKLAIGSRIVEQAGKLHPVTRPKAELQAAISRRCEFEQPRRRRCGTPV